MHVVNKVCESFARRVTMVKGAQGTTIHALLSANQSNVPDRRHVVLPLQWTEYEDAHLLNLTHLS
jgi:hypothetical protein